jgi:excisionase family DNA binding protein
MRRNKRNQRLPDLSRKSGRPLTTAELAAMIGMSCTFIRNEIDAGYLRATRIGRGRKPVFRIPLREAQRYVKELGRR